MTLNEQLAERRLASLDWHATRVVPSANDVPDCGVQVVEMGDWPPTGVGSAKVTDTGGTSTSTAGSVGHVIPKAGSSGLVGDVHPPAVTAQAIATAARPRRRCSKASDWER